MVKVKVKVMIELRRTERLPKCFFSRKTILELLSRGLLRAWAVSRKSTVVIRLEVFKRIVTSVLSSCTSTIKVAPYSISTLLYLQPFDLHSHPEQPHAA